MKVNRKDEKRTNERYCELHDHFLLEFLKSGTNVPKSN